MTLSGDQVAVLSLLCDAFVPSVARADDPDGFWARKASDLGVPQLIAYVVSLAPAENQAAMAGVLDLLAGPVGFAVLTPAQREQVLVDWQHSPTAELRAAYSVLAATILPMYYGYADDRGPNPNWRSIGYDGPRAAPPPPPITRPIRTTTVDADTVLDCDTVVVGSGAGGGVVAGELAEAGHDVIVVEKGPYVAEDGFTQRELEMMMRLYEAGGSLRTRDAAITVLAGSCLGGGTTVNWSGALRTPDYVLDEWARDHGVTHVLSDAYRASIEAVEAATNVNLDETHVDAKGAALQRGADALGYLTKLYPRNVKGCDPAVCGYCNLGCQRGAKQGTLKTYLQRAHDRGARVLADTFVDRVVVEAGRAVGIEAVQAGHRVTIRARRVVVAAGALHTPGLLRRSGLAHPWIGQNLYLHPAAGVPARYPEEIRAWSGAMMPLSVDQFTRVSGNYGFKLINAPLHPAWLVGLDWRSGAEHKERMLESPRLSSIGAFLRDRDTGSVDSTSGRPVIDYTLSPFDRDHMVRALQEAARIHFAAGAELIYLPGGRRFDCASGKEALESLLASASSWSFDTCRVAMLTAHQMGTCRMGASSDHPVRPDGRTLEVADLYIADASVFPTCSGANPMPSIQHLAHYTAQGIKSAS